MRAQLYHVLRKTTSQQTRNRLKRRVGRTRQQLAPLYKLRYGCFNANDVRAVLSRRAPADFEILMVHCSYNDLQPMFVGGVSELLNALMSLCGPERTLAMPAFYSGGADGDVVSHYRRQPVFDVKRQPSEMGLLSEVFRRRKGVRRSLHPTHSVSALGPLAEELTERHHLAGTTFGEGTPFGVMAARRTAIVGIGVEYFRCLTQVHAAEDLLGERYPLPIRQHYMPVTLKDEAGNVRPYALPVETRDLRPHLELVGRLLGPDALVQWRFHGVPLFVTTAGRSTEVLIEAALRGETIYRAPPESARPVAVGIGRPGS
jgi:aminoglycoside 3-N-acetyltransferase